MVSKKEICMFGMTLLTSNYPLMSQDECMKVAKSHFIVANYFYYSIPNCTLIVKDFRVFFFIYIDQEK